MDYPLYKNYIDLSDIRNHFNQLKNYKADISTKPQNTYIPRLLFLIRLIYIRDEKFQRLTDYFSEECRIKCNVKNKISPYFYYQENKELILQNLKKDYSYSDIDSYLYKYGPKQCTNFPVIVALTLLNYLKPKKWLDPSAGWGDRLIAAMAYGECEYMGIDPSECMHLKYKQIIETLDPENESKYKLIKNGFEITDIQKDYFDLVFTSPPFFDLEDYGSDRDQSIVKYKSLKEWKDNFMYPFLQKSVNALKNKGHLALYVNNYTGVNYVEDIINFLKSEKSLKFLGNVAWIGDSYPKKIMIYRKVI